MHKITGILITLTISLSLLMVGIQEVEAKRFGGARSFGSKPSYNRPYRRSAEQLGRSAKQQNAYKQNQAARQSMAKRGGLMGMLGGLALGGLLGAMFFGGAFAGLNFFDILIFGGIAYLLFKIFAAKAATSQSTAYSRSDYSRPGYGQEDNYTNTSKLINPAGFDTDLLFKKGEQNDYPQRSMGIAEDFNTAAVPEGFDELSFLSGAKSAFMQLQEAWDAKNMAKIRSLTTDKVFAEIQQQIISGDSDNNTEILKISAEVLDVSEINGQFEAVVLFDTIMREEVNQRANQVREIWHFIKSRQSIQKTWYLDGIQQLEN